MSLFKEKKSFFGRLGEKIADAVCKEDRCAHRNNAGYRILHQLNQFLGRRLLLADQQCIDCCNAGRKQQQAAGKIAGAGAQPLGKQCGFKEIGRRRKCRFINGRYYDSIIMDILAEEFTESYIKNKNIK